MSAEDALIKWAPKEEKKKQKEDGNRKSHYIDV
jgi:hypothetical protein